MARIPLVTEFESRGLDRAVKEFKKLEGVGAKVGYGLKKAFLPATAALGGLAAAAGVSVKAAAEDAAQQAELARQLEATTGATDKQIAAVESYIAETELAAAVTDSELRPAFANLVRATGDVTEAQELMSLALDVAAGTGKDLQTVTEALQEATMGEVGPLKELDRSLTDMISSGADADEVMGKLADTFGGAAAESTETVEGKFKLMKIQLDNTKESIGKALLPVLETLLPYLERMATWISENTELFLVIGAVVGTFAAAIVAANIALGIFNTIQGITTALNIAMGRTADSTTASFTAMWVATGVGIIIAIIAAIVVLQLKFNILGKAADLIKFLFENAWAAIKWTINKAIDGINELIGLINKIPGIDIPQIGHIGDQAEEAGNWVDQFTQHMARAENQTDRTTQTFLQFDKGLIEIEDQSKKLTKTLGRVNEAFDPLNEGIETATTRLDKFFNSLDQQKATDEFIEEIKEIERTLGNAAIGSDQFIEAQNDAYEAVRQLRNEREDLSDAFYEALIINIDQGNLAYVVELMGKLEDLGGIEIPVDFAVTGADLITGELGLTAGSLFGGQNFAGGFSQQTTNIILPPGTTPAEVLAAQREENTRRGVATYEVAGAGNL